jgi:hypothetical protein
MLKLTAIRFMQRKHFWQTDGRRPKYQYLKSSANARPPTRAVAPDRTTPDTTIDKTQVWPSRYNTPQQ